jgi:hypothetical protein
LNLIKFNKKPFLFLTWLEKVTEVFKDSVPFNARITVDYVSGSVKFDYPNKDMSNWRKYYIITSCLYSPMFLIGVVPTIALLLIILTFIRFFIYPSLNLPTTFLYVLLSPFIMSLVIINDYNKYSATLPKLPALVKKLSGDYYVADISTMNGTILEIPSFRNILLDYEASGDFSRFLDKVEIREHPVRVVRGGRSKVNDVWWKAVFTFSQQPMNGSIKIVLV